VARHDGAAATATDADLPHSDRVAPTAVHVEDSATPGHDIGTSPALPKRKDQAGSPGGLPAAGTAIAHFGATS